MRKKDTLYFLAAIAVFGIFLSYQFKHEANAQTSVKKAAKASGQEWTTAKQFTFAWDAALLSEDLPVPAGDVVKYQPYLKPEGGVATAYGAEIVSTQVTMTLPNEGKYRACVQAIRYPSWASERIVSEVSCSDNVAVVKDSQPWGVIYYLMIDGPKGLKRVN